MNPSSSDIAAAYAHCARMAREHYENFPVASLLLPGRMRPPVAAIYAFARQADDFADEPDHAGRRLELLRQWRSRLDRAARDDADHPIFIALADTIRNHRLPLTPLHDLISAFEQDVTVRSYETFEQLAAYCRLSANPVGRLILHLFGHRDEAMLAQSDAICTALQLANFWQDVGVDLDKGRCYIPGEDLERFGCSRDHLAERRRSDAFADVLRFEIGRTRELFSRGAALPSAVGGRLGFELKLVVLGGLRVLERIEQADCDVFTRRPSLKSGDWARLMMRATFFTPSGLRGIASR